MNIDQAMMELLLVGIAETLYMTLVSTLIAYVIGLPLGVFLVVSEKDGILPMPFLNKVFGVIVNLLRSVPFLILMVALIPVTRFIIGTAIGATATIVPLVIGATPFVARMVESSIKEVDYGLIEASLSMGASPLKIIGSVLIPEARPSLIVGAAISVTTILGYSAMAGFLGGGGLGTIATNYGFYRYETGILMITIVLLIIIVQVLQEVGMWISRRQDKRR